MSNINRRDYLKGMAASAGVIAASKLEIFGQGSRRRGRRQQTRKATPTRTTRAIVSDPSILNWRITETRPPSDAFVTAVFSGLMGFSYDPEADDGRVGFHKGHGNHQLAITIYRADCSLHTEQPVITSSTRNITLRVLPQSIKPVEYFELQPDQMFDRRNGDPNDFRWLPDLDGGDFYPDLYVKHQDHYRPWLHVKDATFYTLMRTNSTFNLVIPRGNQSVVIRDFGHVARFMAAAIDLPNNGHYVALQVDSATPILLRPGGNVRYQILFSNECQGQHCVHYDVCSDDETLRNDFHFARKVLKIPNGRAKIGLKIKQKYPPAPLTGLCGLSNNVGNYDNPCETNRATDEAPCMGAGYGNDRL